MDSKEFSMKMDRLKKLVAEKDYATALKIVDAIDWNRVKSANLLALASSVYEENGMLTEAKEILAIALQRSTGGKRILYKLTELAVRSGDVEDAMDYYQEYSTVAPEDPGCLLLQYMILKVRHAPYSQLIKCLELYNEYEPDEKWMYELATTYESAGRVQDAVALCDRIALMFGNSPYVVKALKLKQKYAKLSDEQRASLYPNSIAGAGKRYTPEETDYIVTKTVREPEAAEERLGDRLAANRIENEDAAFEAYYRLHDPFQGQDVPEETPIVPEETLRGAEGPITVEREPEPAELPEEQYAEPEPARKAVPLEREHINEGFITQTGEPVETEEIRPELPEDGEAEEPKPARVFSVELPPEKDPDAELLKADARIAEAKLARTAGEEETAAPRLQARTTFTAAGAGAPEKAVPEGAAGKKIRPGIHMIIEALEEEEGISIARKELALICRIRGDRRNVAKASAEKLNSLGDMDALLAKIGDRDLVIVRAGSLKQEVAEQLLDLMEKTSPERSIIYVDTPEGLDALEEKLPVIFDVCDILTDEDAREKDYSIDEETEEEENEPVRKDAVPQREEAEDAEDEGDEPDTGASSKKARGRRGSLLNNSGNIPFRMPESDDEIMEFEDFAQYCIYYANDKGCGISGKTLLALYEKIEIMEEDGIALTRIAAEDCVEEAADHAEHPGLKGLFRRKYDKDDMLILREEDFIN